MGLVPTLLWLPIAPAPPALAVERLVVACHAALHERFQGSQVCIRLP